MLSFRYSSSQLAKQYEERDDVLKRYGLIIKVSVVAVGLIITGLVGYFIVSHTTADKTVVPRPNPVSDKINPDPTLQGDILEGAEDIALKEGLDIAQDVVLNDGGSPTSSLESLASAKKQGAVFAFFLKHKKAVIIGSVAAVVIILLVIILTSVYLYNKHLKELEEAARLMMIEEERAAAALQEQLNQEQESAGLWSFWGIVKIVSIAFVVNLIFTAVMVISSGGIHSKEQLNEVLLFVFTVSGIPFILLACTAKAIEYLARNKSKEILANICRFILTVLHVLLLAASIVPLFLLWFISGINEFYLSMVTIRDAWAC